MGNPGTTRPGWFDDVHRLVDVAEQYRDGLPKPSIDSGRADFRFTDIPHAPDTRAAVESALRTLGRELGLSFRPDPRRTGFGSARHAIYEAVMPSGLVVSVTANGRHIKAGKRSECAGCPVALAVHDAFPHASDIRVTAAALYMTDSGRHVRIPLPEEAGDFIGAFDDGYPVKPFSFTVEYEGTVA